MSNEVKIYYGRNTYRQLRFQLSNASLVAAESHCHLSFEPLLQLLFVLSMQTFLIQ